MVKHYSKNGVNYVEMKTNEAYMLKCTRELEGKLMELGVDISKAYGENQDIDKNIVTFSQREEKCELNQ